jgi:phosphatidylserine/phosphatidylglycerophosphate/cardiolipin synthase-like enzyme
MVNNKTLRSPKLFFYILFLLPIFVQAMEEAPKRTQPSAVTTRVMPLEPCRLFATRTDENIIGQMASDIKMAQNDDYIGLESPFLTHSLIIHELIEAANRGAQIKIFSDPESIEKIAPLFSKTTAQLISMNNLHAKRMVIRAGNLKIVWLGSMNMSEHSRENHEIMMRCTDPESFKESIGDQLRLNTEYYNRAAAQVDFTKRRIINSSTNEAQKAKKKVIEEFSLCAHPHDYLYFAAYTLDDDAIVQTLINAKQQSHKPITVLLDRKNWVDHRLRAKTVAPLVNAGLEVYIFNKNENIKTAFGYHKDMHLKAILRKCNQECVSLVSTANFTPRGLQEINHDLWEPCSLAFSRRLKDIIDTIILESVLITSKDFPTIQTLEKKSARLLELMKHDNLIYPNKEEILQLIQEGADPNAQANDRTLLMAAINVDQIDIARALINAGADVNKVTQGGFYTALIQAAMQGHVAIVQLLIDAKAELDRSDQFGNTALYLTIRWGRDPKNEVAKLLIKAGADVNLGGDYLKGREKEYGGVIPPIVMAAKRGNNEIVKALLAAGANPNARDRNGFTALEYACEDRNASMIKMLAQNQANLNIPNPRTGETALIRAVSANDYELAKALINAGADVQAMDPNGKTAIYYAARKKSQKMVNLLNSVKK